MAKKKTAPPSPMRACTRVPTKVAKKVEPIPAVIPIPFPVDHFDESPPAVLQERPAVDPKKIDDFEVQCKITSLGTRYWSGLVFVALEATDGQDLLTMLHQGQEVVVHYRKE